MGALPVAGWFRNTRGLGVDLTVAVHRSSEQSHRGTGVRSSTLTPAGGYAEVQATFLSGKGPFYLARPHWPSEQTFRLGALISPASPRVALSSWPCGEVPQAAPEAVRPPAQPQRRGRDEG